MVVYKYLSRRMDSPTDGLVARSGLGGCGESTAAVGLSDGESASCWISKVRWRTARGAGRAEEEAETTKDLRQTESWLNNELLQ